MITGKFYLKVYADQLCDSTKTHARLLFVDFSSAFNTIQLHILASKLLYTFNLDSGMVKWVLNFLTRKPQAVRANSALSQKQLSSIGPTQQCVLSPLFYILYTNDCRSNDNSNDNRLLLTLF